MVETLLRVINHDIERCGREFFAAKTEEREPNGTLAQALSAMQTLDRLKKVFR